MQDIAQYTLPGEEVRGERPVANGFGAHYNSTALGAKKVVIQQVGKRFRGRKLFWKTLLIVLVLQTAAFCIAGFVLYQLAAIDLSRDFYSAHRSLQAARSALLPSTIAACVVGLILAAAGVSFGLLYFTRRFTAPIMRADAMLQRMAQGSLAILPGVLTSSERWALDDSADAVLASVREKILDIQRLNKDMNNAVLSLRYKTTGEETITLKELREIASTLDIQCKKVAETVKWFEI